MNTEPDMISEKSGWTETQIYTPSNGSASFTDLLCTPAKPFTPGLHLHGPYPALALVPICQPAATLSQASWNFSPGSKSNTRPSISLICGRQIVSFHRTFDISRPPDELCAAYTYLIYTHPERQ